MKIFKTFFIALVVILGLGALGLGILSKGLFRKASDTVGGLAGKAKNEAEGLDIPRHRYLSVAL